MKTTAARSLVIAAGVLALGSLGFGQTTMTAEIPFAFHTATGTLPAGQYEFVRAPGAALPNLIAIRNSATQHSTYAGNAVYDGWTKARYAPAAEFRCAGNSCTLTAVRTWSGSWEYAAPRKSRNADGKVARIAVPLKPIATD